MELIKILNFVQGSLSSSGEYDDETRLRTDFVEIPAGTQKIQGVPKFVRKTYDKSTKQYLYSEYNGSPACTAYLYDAQRQIIAYFSAINGVDISAYTWAVYVRFVICIGSPPLYLDGNLETSGYYYFLNNFDFLTDVLSWEMDENFRVFNKKCPIVPEKPMYYPYPDALWRIDYISPNMPYHRLFPDIKAINMWSLPRENIIRVYDYREPQNGFKHNGLAILAPSECIEYHELNGRWDVELTHPVDDWGRWKNILPQNVLKVDGQLFRIDEHTSVSGSDGMYIKVHAKHISYDLADEFVHYYWGENLNGYEFIRAMFGACLTDVDFYDKYNFQYNSDIEERTGQFEITDKSLLNSLIGGDNCLINQLGGELFRNNFYFSINKRMEGARDNAFALKYGFDMSGISQKIDYSELTTWLMVDNNYGDSFAVSYVNDVYPIHHHKHSFRCFSYSDSSNSMERLVRDGQELFGQLCRPKISYEVNIVSLKNNSKYSDFLDLQNYRLGDRGTIECEQLGIKTTQEIIAVETDRLTGDIRKIKLGNENYSLIRPAYKSNVSSSISPSEDALQKQITDLLLDTYITTPITTKDGKYLTTKDNKYITYKE